MTCSMQRPLSRSTAPNTHKPCTIRPRWHKSKTRRSQRRSAARRCRTHRAHRPAPGVAACLLCRRLLQSCSDQSTMEWTWSEARRPRPKCHATWCDGTPATHEKRIQTSFPSSILLLKKLPFRRPICPLQRRHLHRYPSWALRCTTRLLPKTDHKPILSPSTKLQTNINRVKWNARNHEWAHVHTSISTHLGSLDDITFFCAFEPGIRQVCDDDFVRRIGKQIFHQTLRIVDWKRLPRFCF